MRAFISIILFFSIVYFFMSCKKVDLNTHFTYYFIENNTGSTLKISPSLISENTELYCNNCIIVDAGINQLASNITTIGDIPPAETFKNINVYRNDSLKLVITDSLLQQSVWNKNTPTETITDYTYTISNL